MHQQLLKTHSLQCRRSTTTNPKPQQTVRRQDCVNHERTTVHLSSFSEYLLTATGWDHAVPGALCIVQEAHEVKSFAGEGGPSYATENYVKHGHTNCKILI